MRSYLILLGLGILLCGAPSAHAQQAAYDILNCGDRTADVERAIRGALERWDKVDRAEPSLAQRIFARSFGDFSADPAIAQWGVIAFAGQHYNIRALLTGRPLINSLGGPPPSPRRAVFKCMAGPPPDIARIRGGEIYLYTELFFKIPLSAPYGTGQGSQVGTILHEAMHIASGTGDVRVNGANTDVSASLLVQAKDLRTFSNAENYEMYYMSFLF